MPKTIKTIKEIYWDGVRRQQVCMAHVNLLDQAWGYMTSQLYTYPESAKWYMMSTDIHFKAIEEKCKVGEWDWKAAWVDYALEHFTYPQVLMAASVTRLVWDWGRANNGTN